jgi:hypothetical protein
LTRNRFRFFLSFFFFIIPFKKQMDLFRHFPQLENTHNTSWTLADRFLSLFFKMKNTFYLLLFIPFSLIRAERDSQEQSPVLLIPPHDFDFSFSVWWLVGVGMKQINFCDAGWKRMYIVSCFGLLCVLQANVRL